ncbi:MAG: hypothetical protein JNK05_00075 [Myxococcales bacterium]|nr:hypothetical protein [Myxococcales bacterium]
MHPTDLPVARAPYHLGGSLSLVLVSLLVAALFALVLFCIVERRRATLRAHRERQAHTINSPLSKGPATVRGTVVLDPREPFAVQATITQDVVVIEPARNTREWREVSRSIESQSFKLQTTTGEIIEVETDEATVFLYASLREREWLEPKRRRFRATVRAGDTVSVRGRLRPRASSNENTYRTTAVAWTLGPDNHRLEVVADEPGHRDAMRARAFARTALALIVVAAPLALAPMATYFVRAARGRVETAEYAGRTGSINASAGKKPRLIVFGDVAGSTLSLDVEAEDFRAFDAFEQRARVAFQPVRALWAMEDSAVRDARPTLRVYYVADAPSLSVIGPRNTTNGLCFALSAVIVFAIATRVAKVHRHRRWYEGPLVHELGFRGLRKPSGQRFH